MTRIAICATIRESPCLADWLAYHRAIGIDHVYLYLHGEDIPQCVWDGVGRDWLTLRRSLVAAGTIRRSQCANVVDAIGLARGRQDWLLHIDGDELLHVPGGDLQAVFPTSGSDACQLVFRNLEVAKSSTRLDDYAFFREERLFKSPDQSAGWLSYVNGKAAGNLHLAGLEPNEVHRFRCSVDGPALDVPLESAAVLHYPFCLYRHWRNKPNIVEDRHRLPMPFYERSREVLEQGDEAEMRRFFLDSVVCANSAQALARGEVTRIDGSAEILARTSAHDPVVPAEIETRALAAVRAELHREPRFHPRRHGSSEFACLALLSGDLTSTALLFHLLEGNGMPLQVQHVSFRHGTTTDDEGLERVLAVVEYCLRSCREFEFAVTTDGALPVAGQSTLWELAFSAARFARARPDVGLIVSGDGGIDATGFQAVRHVVAGCFWGAGRLPDWLLPFGRLPKGLLARALPAELRGLTGP